MARFQLPLIVLIAFVAGCGPRLPETTPVSGTIRVNGEPISQGKIIFYPEEGRPAMSDIAADGTYRLTTFREQDGAVLGQHRVTIKSTRITGTPAPRTFDDELAQARGESPIRASVIHWLVPEEYSRQETTPLTRTVDRETDTLDFDFTQ